VNYRDAMFEAPNGLLRFLTRYEEHVQMLAHSLRSLVLQELAPCHEYIFEMRSKVVLLYGASDRVIADGVCSIGVFRRHVTLTFVEGVDLQDPHRVLQGSGKTMRHIRIASDVDVNRPELRDFLRQARALPGITSPSGEPGATGTTRVKERSARPGRTVSAHYTRARQRHVVRRTRPAGS
jgi:hypothetical protein